MGELSPGHVRVAEVAALAPGEATTFTFDRDGEAIEAFVLRVPGEDDVLVAYVNRCAHVSFDLDMGTGRFWSPKTGRIYCMTHGARYEPVTGECDAGPCVGARLTKLPVRRDGRDAIVEIPGVARQHAGVSGRVCGRPRNDRSAGSVRPRATSWRADHRGD